MSRGGNERDWFGLSPEDAALWDYVTRSVRPTAGMSGKTDGKAHVRIPGRAAEHHGERPAQGAVECDAGQPSRSMPPAQGPSPTVARPSAPRTTPTCHVSHSPHPPSHAPLAQPIVLERRQARRIAKAGWDIDARLDLHGMTQETAHRALEHFLRRAQADGVRTAIVITGKGGPLRDDGGDAGGHGGRERGVLRRMVPQWLEGSSLRGIVIGYSNAHPRHGGSGALYVMLRRAGK